MACSTLRFSNRILEFFQPVSEDYIEACSIEDYPDRDIQKLYISVINHLFQKMGQ